MMLSVKADRDEGRKPQGREKRGEGKKGERKKGETDNLRCLILIHKICLTCVSLSRYPLCLPSPRPRGEYLETQILESDSPGFKYQLQLLGSLAK